MLCRSFPLPSSLLPLRPTSAEVVLVGQYLIPILLTLVLEILRLLQPPHCQASHVLEELVGRHGLKDALKERFVTCTSG